MHILLHEINILLKMFCTGIYEGENFDNIDDDEHMHCFVMYYLNNKVYQIESPNWEKKLGYMNLKMKKKLLLKLITII